ncbi:hypothetical protein SAMN05428981_101660 [Bacillus sp. OV194]|nr:hypothetical protein SAMN05428981_101660 [Bacillus sp. OV194]
MSREVLKKRIHQHFDRKKIKNEQLETLLVRFILSLKKEK